jgi:hypothetical protein
MAFAPVFYIRCPPFETLKANLQRNPGVVKSQWYFAPKIKNGMTRCGRQEARADTAARRFDESNIGLAPARAEF